MRIGAIVQARTSSKRFPFKIFSKIGDSRVIDRILSDLTACNSLDEIILAYPEEEKQYFTEYESSRVVKCFAGAKDNVLKRIFDAAVLYNLDAVVRVCADSPFILSWLINYGVSIFKENKIDYLLTNCFPKGQNIEIVTTDALRKIQPVADKEEAEHVTLYFERHPTVFVCKTLDMEFVVDTPEDLAELNKLMDYI